MEFKGTKGDWKINNSNEEGSLISIKDPNRDICTVWQYDIDFLEIQESRANALLISKAPEMLDMLDKCRIQLVMCTFIDKTGQCSETVEKVVKLIKEATEL